MNFSPESVNHRFITYSDSLTKPHNLNHKPWIYQIYLNNTASGSIQSIVEISSMSLTAAFFIPWSFTLFYQFYSIIALGLFKWASRTDGFVSSGKVIPTAFNSINLANRTQKECICMLIAHDAAGDRNNAVFFLKSSPTF